MSQELHYTSAPRGLGPGTKGFCTVAATPHMVPRLVDLLEGLSGYRAVYSPNDPKAELNPVASLHLAVPFGSKKLHVLSRVAAAGVDHTSRSNVYAHHLVLDPSERPEGGPAWLLLQPGVIDRSFRGEPRLLPAGREVPKGGRGASACSAWEAVAGDAGWAGVVAESVRSQPQRVVNLIFEPGQDLLPLIDEALALLPPSKRWEVNFCSYYTALPPDVSCTIRGVLDGSEQAEFARRKLHDALTIDLTRPLPAATGGPLVEAARTGILPPPPVAEPPPAPDRPADRPAAAKPDRERTAPTGAAAPPPTSGRPDHGGGYGIAPPPLPTRPFPAASPPPLGPAPGSGPGFDWKNPPLLVALGFLLGVAVTATVGLLLRSPATTEPAPVEVASNPRPTRDDFDRPRPDISSIVKLPDNDTGPPAAEDPPLDTPDSDQGSEPEEPTGNDPSNPDEVTEEGMETGEDSEPTAEPTQEEPGTSPTEPNADSSEQNGEDSETPEDQPTNPPADAPPAESPVTAGPARPGVSRGGPSPDSTPPPEPAPAPEPEAEAPVDQKIEVRLLRSPLPGVDRMEWEILEVDGMIPDDALVTAITPPAAPDPTTRPPVPGAVDGLMRFLSPGNSPVPIAEVRVGEAGLEFRWLKDLKAMRLQNQDAAMSDVRDSVITLKGKANEGVPVLLRSRVDLPDATFPALSRNELPYRAVWSISEANPQGRTYLPLKLLALRGDFKDDPDDPPPLTWSRDEGEPTLKLPDLPEVQGKPQPPPLVLQFSTPASAKDSGLFVLKRTVLLESRAPAPFNAAGDYKSRLGDATLEVSAILGVEVKVGEETKVVEILRLGEWPDEERPEED